ncbi:MULTISPECIES: restriction endonuclease subunit S [unclassified Providencia]|uniref:restriction endonuclease subunit S n=1 Tax=unclassified Providencia TaxID=2633465 RepID=UPI0023490D50|nr:MULTISPECIES: restriction endonuclease subunit S [unclassified Providencia]
MTVEKLITDHIDIWSSALQTRSTAGRGSNGKIDLYGIKKLRELILELAVRGKLVPQDPNDEPASELLKRIEKEREGLVKSRKIRKSKVLEPVDTSELPFELPRGWEWCYLNDVGNWGAGATPNRSNSKYYDGNIPWFKSGELSSDFISESEEKVTELALKECSLRDNKVGDVLIAMYGATIGKTSILNVRGTTNQAVCACTPYSGISNVYLLTLLKAYKRIFIGMGAGGAQPNISREKLIATVIALPPNAEQNRIVYKVNELMSLCDQLEQQSLTSLDTHQQLVETLLATLTDSKNAKELAENWSRINQHFDTLFTTEASIDALKQTILQLAVMGKLTEQEKACTLECKTSLIDGLSIYDDIDKRIPKTWSLSKLDNISSAIIDCPHSTPKWADKGFICVRTNQIKPGYLELNDSRYVSEQTYIERIQRLEPSFNDILYSREGGVLGVACRIPEDVKVCLGQRMMLIRSGDKVLSEYLEIVLNSPLITILARQMTTGGAAPRINVSTVKNYLIPLPPKEEQYQIIARVKELLNLGDTLKSHLQSAQQTQLHLADALTDAALN